MTPLEPAAHLGLEQLAQLPRIFRLNLINSITGFKPANLIGSISADGHTNLAIISSVIHMGSNPGLLGFLLRPPTVSRHTHENIQATGEYTINHVHSDFIGQAHYTAAKFDRGESEFDASGLTPSFIPGFKAPFVQESRVKIGLRLVDQVPIPANGTILIIGQIEHAFFPKFIQQSDGALEIDRIDTVCISGLDTYHKTIRLDRFPFARPGQPPFGSIGSSKEKK